MRMKYKNYLPLTDDLKIEPLLNFASSDSNLYDQQRVSKVSESFCYFISANEKLLKRNHVSITQSCSYFLPKVFYLLKLLPPLLHHCKHSSALDNLNWASSPNRQRCLIVSPFFVKWWFATVSRSNSIKTSMNVSRANEYASHSITIRLIRNHIIRIIHKSEIRI